MQKLLDIHFDQGFVFKLRTRRDHKEFLDQIDYFLCALVTLWQPFWPRRHKDTKEEKTQNKDQDNINLTTMILISEF